MLGILKFTTLLSRWAQSQILVIILGTAVIVAVQLFLSNFNAVAENTEINVEEIQPMDISDTQLVEQIFDDELVNQLQALFVGSEVGMAVHDLRTGATYNLNADTVFSAASTSKLLIASYAFHLADQELLNLDEQLDIDLDDLQSYGSGVIHLQQPPYVFSYRELIQVMLEESDNTAAYVLSKYLDKDAINRYAKELGIMNTDFLANSTTPADMLHLMEMIYMQQIATSSLNMELLSYLDDSSYEDRIPALLPDTATVYHKIGTALDGGIHDVGVVEYNGEAYALSVFTSNFAASQQATDAIAQASLLLFNSLTLKSASN